MEKCPFLFVWFIFIPFIINLSYNLRVNINPNIRKKEHRFKQQGTSNEYITGR